MEFLGGKVVEGLKKEEKEGVKRREGGLLIMGGGGSGKRRVLRDGVGYLMVEKGVKG